MAIRVQNSAVENFGILADETVITHGRVSVGSVVLVTRPLLTPRTIAAGGRAEFEIGDIDLVFPSSEFEDAGFNALLALAFNGTNSLNIDAMTSDSAVVTTSGYTQQATADWNLSTEPD